MEQMQNAELIIIDALDRVMEVIDGSPIPRFRTDDRLRIVNSDQIAEMLSDIRNQLPGDIRKANSLIMRADTVIQEAVDYAERITKEARSDSEALADKAQREAKTTVNEARAYYNEQVASGDDYLSNKTIEGDKYLADKIGEGDAYYADAVARARRDAEQIIKEANIQREELISDNSITLEAQKRAEELRVKTVQRSNEVYNNAKRSADDVFATLLHHLEDYYAAIEQDRNALDIRASKTEAKVKEEQSFEPADNARCIEDIEDEDERGGVTSLFFDLFKRKKRSQFDDEDDRYDDGIDE